VGRGRGRYGRRCADSERRRRVHCDGGVGCVGLEKGGFEKQQVSSLRGNRAHGGYLAVRARERRAGREHTVEVPADVSVQAGLHLHALAKLTAIAEPAGGTDGAAQRRGGPAAVKGQSQSARQARATAAAREASPSHIEDDGRGLLPDKIRQLAGGDLRRHRGMRPAWALVGPLCAHRVDLEQRERLEDVADGVDGGLGDADDFDVENEAGERGVDGEDHGGFGVVADDGGSGVGVMQVLACAPIMPPVSCCGKRDGSRV
jgi:hypothetical protein